MSADRIHKQIALRASPARVWRALSDAREFGTWFGVALDGELAPGTVVHGAVVFEGKTLSIAFHVERMEPERLLAFRWHPHAVDPEVDYAGEPMTLVEIALAPAGSGTLVTVTESGFGSIPLARRARAFEMNSGGWAAQLDNIARHVDA